VPPATLGAHLEKICEAEGIKVAKGVIPLVVRASGGSVRDALSVLGQLLAGAGKDGVTYEIAVALLGYTDGALLDESIDAIAARDGATLFTTVDRVIESGSDPRRFAQDLLERLRDLIIVGAVDENNSQVLNEYPEDQLERIRTQSKLIGVANLIRSADIVAEGLTQMRGATPPRLLLELMCGRILLPASDDSAVLARIERLEKAATLTPINKSEPAPVAKAEPVKEKVVEKPAEKVVASDEKTEAPKAAPASKPTGSVDVAALRRMWPDVIENVKKRRRLTWSLLSASAQILGLDEQAITIGIVNAGARDSFIRSGSDQILADAFEEVTGLKRKIECTVDPSVTGTPTARADEDPSDENMLTGTDLLAKELGAKIIKESH
jgi:DNA polymerase-3 subunit gamma/tau